MYSRLKVVNSEGLRESPFAEGDLQETVRPLETDGEKFALYIFLAL